jgi:cytochrome o ubiquinol oxidase operon protein cyoD
MTSQDHHIEPNYGTGKKTLAQYSIGLGLCTILTLVPFAAVMYSALSISKTLSILIVSAVLQFWVQAHCFLRLHVRNDEGRLNVGTFAFSIFVLGIIVGGSLWIMNHLDYNMMH